MHKVYLKQTLFFHLHVSVAGVVKLYLWNFFSRLYHCLLIDHVLISRRFHAHLSLDSFSSRHLYFDCCVPELRNELLVLG
jgi:hypothetical protein